MLAHGLAVEQMRATSAPGAEFGDRPQPRAAPACVREPEADVAAARLVDGMHNRIFLDPILRGAYPEDVLAHLEPLVGLGHIQDGDLETISAPLDLLGVNYYRPVAIAAARTEPAPARWHALAGRRVRSSAIPQERRADDDGLGGRSRRARASFCSGSAPTTAGSRCSITENGAAFDDRVEPTGASTTRIGSRSSTAISRAVHRALEAGVDLRGYFVWSLLDNFEWAEGTASASASSTSTTRRSVGRRRRAPVGTPA